MFSSFLYVNKYHTPRVIKCSDHKLTIEHSKKYDKKHNFIYSSRQNDDTRTQSALFCIDKHLE